MLEEAAKILNREYKVPLDNVVVIPHGVPNFTNFNLQLKETAHLRAEVAELADAQGLEPCPCLFGGEGSNPFLGTTKRILLGLALQNQLRRIKRLNFA